MVTPGSGKVKFNHVLLASLIADHTKSKHTIFNRWSLVNAYSMNQDLFSFHATNSADWGQSHFSLQPIRFPPQTSVSQSSCYSNKNCSPFSQRSILSTQFASSQWYKFKLTKIEFIESGVTGHSADQKWLTDSQARELPYTCTGLNSVLCKTKKGKQKKDFQRLGTKMKQKIN